MFWLPGLIISSFRNHVFSIILRFRVTNTLELQAQRHESERLRIQYALLQLCGAIAADFCQNFPRI